MKYDARAQRKKGGLSDADDMGCGQLTMTADTNDERRWLTAIYFINAPALPRNEKRKRELAALRTLQQWITAQRTAIRKSIQS